MDEAYNLEPTTAEVWAVIHASHRGHLKVFGSYSAPEGDQFGNPDQGVMETTYGFEGADFPLMKAVTTWDIDREKSYNRPNEKHAYWLCLPNKEEEL